MKTVKKGGTKDKNSKTIFCSYCFPGDSKPEFARMQKKLLKRRQRTKDVNPNTGIEESNHKSYFFVRSA